MSSDAAAVLLPRCFALVALLSVSCTTATVPNDRVPQGSAPQSAAAVKRINAAISGDPHTLYQKLNANNAVRGIVALEMMVNAGLVYEDESETLHPQLAVAVPTVENGNWRVLADGRMETSWQIREGAQWHDGTPVTGQDLVFTNRVWQDPDLPALANIALRTVDAVEAPSSQSVTVRWNAPYIHADKMFAIAMALPLPRHILEQPYLDDKAHFLDHPYWTTEFQGTGPYRLREWVVGSHLFLEANARYVLGPPKIGEIEVRFIFDSNAIMANLLAGSIDVGLDRTLSFEQAEQARAAGWDGEAHTQRDTGFNLWPQLLDPKPAMIADVRFRRALLQGVDREEIAAVLLQGKSAVFHSWVREEDPSYPELAPQIVQYPYEPRRATQIVEGLGFVKGPDGGFRDPAGQRLGVEARTISQDINQKVLFAIVDYWQRLGVAAEPLVVPTARQNDLQYRAEFPGFDLLRRGISPDEFITLHSSGVRVAENNYRGYGGGTNYTRYVNAEYDALVDRFFVTIPRKQRMEIAGKLANIVTDQVLVLPMFFDPIPLIVSHRITGIRGRTPWNIAQWDVAAR